MFRTPNPYDELVVAGTAETLTDVNWEKFLEICDKVSEEGETGARNAISAILKRLAHRNPNVQTFALELSNSLSENCGKEVHREISSKSFTDGLERVITDRTTNDKVRTKVLGLIRKWNEVFKEGDEGEIMHELYERLSKNSEYSQALTGSTISEPAPDEDRERARAAEEEAELQRVLELSKQEVGGRGRNGGGAGGSSSSSNGVGGSSSSQVAGGSSSSGSRAAPSQAPMATAAAPAAAAPSSQPVTPPLQQALRVRALYTYTPSNPTELAFEAGSVIKVIGRTYAEWWRGTLRGRVGIFPVNYVESMPSPTEDELRQEREAEDEIFAKVAQFDELLEKLRGVDIARDGGIPDDVEELYASCVGLQSRLADLIGKYAGYKADLETISNIFSQAAYSYQTMKNPQIAPPAPQMYAAPHQYAQQQFATPPADQAPPQAAIAQDQRPVVQHHGSGSSIRAQAAPPQQQQQQLSPEWEAYYAAQAAAARGQPAQIPGQSSAPAQQHVQAAPVVAHQGSQDAQSVPFPAQAGGGGATPYSPQAGQDPYQQQHQQAYDPHQRHPSQSPALHYDQQQPRPTVLSNASQHPSYIQPQQQHPVQSQSPQPYAASPATQPQYAQPPPDAGGYMSPPPQQVQHGAQAPGYAYPSHPPQ